VLLDLGQTLRPDRRSEWTRAGIGTRVIQDGLPVFHSGGISWPGPGVRASGTFPRTAGSFASFSIRFGVGMRPLAGRSVIPQ
jgi:hypothetical protein